MTRTMRIDFSMFSKAHVAPADLQSCAAAMQRLPFQARNSTSALVAASFLLAGCLAGGRQSAQLY